MIVVEASTPNSCDIALKGIQLSQNGQPWPAKLCRPPSGGPCRFNVQRFKFLWASTIYCKKASIFLSIPSGTSWERPSNEHCYREGLTVLQCGQQAAHAVSHLTARAAQDVSENLVIAPAIRLAKFDVFSRFPIASSNYASFWICCITSGL